MTKILEPPTEVHPPIFQWLFCCLKQTRNTLLVPNAAIHSYYWLSATCTSVMWFSAKNKRIFQWFRSPWKMTKQWWQEAIINKSWGFIFKYITKCIIITLWACFGATVEACSVTLPFKGWAPLDIERAQNWDALNKASPTFFLYSPARIGLYIMPCLLP